MKLRLLQISLAVWFLAALFDVCWLIPPIFLLSFGNLLEISQSRFTLVGLTSTGGFILALYALSVSIVGMALLKIARKIAEGGWHESSAGHKVFIFVSSLSYVLPILEWAIGTCTVSSDFGGIHVGCQSGLLAVLPAFLASTVLMVTALAIREFAPSVTDQP